ncbi:3-hydroxyacyl-CoA dehydrogenase NAD-binding domain-containing protein [Nocardia ninae]|uniref:Putative 3-hydroxyacyl-CoA dehydrogenase n=1 Tax=Nocardia ninae NBRC 108245 TaxID=1210091 RepID=A0A511MH08_9NOCA|nr:3-hydroxyacyl-CoA dehydrogenase NAD-binding domain-containing protein [Nocardia ninae]GEM39973.1 putative 3-hydroxyacyl-CoA dehydrogenase [Nocardia ninae NBRC 108245]
MTTLAVIGAGVIGLSWARLAREHDWDVTIYDPRDDIADVVAAELGHDPRIRIVADIAAAVADADLVQENGPERLPIKQDLFTQIVTHARPDAVLATSSSSITATAIAQGLPDASQVLVGHPFNPPDLMPLVEVVPGSDTADDITKRAVELYQRLDRVPVVIRREMPGFVANRLQLALFREALYLVQQGVLTPADLDVILRNSLGLRWATIGLFEGNVLGGGPAGIRHLYAGVGAQTSTLELGTPSNDPEQMEKVIIQVEQAYGTGTEAFQRLRDKRDTRTRAVLAALNRR